MAILPHMDMQSLTSSSIWMSRGTASTTSRSPRRSSWFTAVPNSKTRGNLTNYLTVRGKDTVFPGKDLITPADIPDGMSNTIMVVEASDAKAVPWAKPDDLAYDEKQPAAGLVGLQPSGSSPRCATARYA